MIGSFVSIRALRSPSYLGAKVSRLLLRWNLAQLGMRVNAVNNFVYIFIYFVVVVETTKKNQLKKKAQTDPFVCFFLQT